MPFASASDVQTRLGRESLSTEETAQADLVIEGVTALITEAVGRDDAWATALSPVPGTLKWLCIEKAAEIVSNPQNLASISEQLGAYQHSSNFQAAASDALGVLLTKEERRKARKAVYGTDVGTGRMESILTPAFPLYADDSEPLEKI